MGTSAAHCKAIVGGSRVFAPSTHARGVRTAVVSKCTTCPAACTPESVRPAQMATTGWPATKPSAFSTASCTETECDCDCHPAKSVPSYSTIAAMRRGSTPRSTTPPPSAGDVTLAGQRLYETRCFLFLAGRAFLHDLFENAAGPLGIAHIHISPCEIQFRA